MNMRLTLFAIFALQTMIGATLYGQFDLGRIIDRGVQQGIGNLKQEVRGAIRQGIQEIQQGGVIGPVTPYPPVRPLPYPDPPILPGPRPIMPSPQPPIYIDPIGQPVDPPVVCPTPVVTGPVIRPIAETTPEVPETPETEAPLPEVAAGQLVAIDGKSFGEDAGGVFVVIGEMVLAAETVNWSDTEVEARLPLLPLVQPTRAVVAVMTADEVVAERLEVALTPATDDEVAEGESEEQTNLDELPTVELGTELTLEGESLGRDAGSVQIVIGEMLLEGEVIRWTETEVDVTLPTMAIASAVAGEIQILTADGELASSVAVALLPPSEADDSSEAIGK